MKKYLLKSIILLAVFCTAITMNAYDFSAKNSDGVIIYYNVLNETERTCEVTYAEQITSYDYSTISKDYEGAIVIPSSVIGYKVSQIGQGAFTCCRNMTSVSIPNSVTNIRRSAFNSCSGLTSITIPTSVITIEYGAFSGCTGLTTVTIPNSVTSLGDGVFYDCRGLTSITIPNSVTTMGRLVFSTCSNLTSIVIPKSVTSIGDNPFIHCNKLTKIVVEEGNLNYDSRNNCNAIIETASNTLIAGCQNTKIPSNVTNIGDYAFLGYTGLTSIVIPSSVTSIGKGVFCDCSGLTTPT